MKSFLYYILDKFIMTDFTSVIAEKLNKYEKLDYFIELIDIIKNNIITIINDN